MSSGRAASLDERERLCSVSRPPSVLASPSDVLVSTRPSKSWLIARGPVGTSATTSSNAPVASSLQASDAASASATAAVAPESVVLNALRTVATAPSTAFSKAWRLPPPTETTATASRGIALRLLPPFNETRRNGASRYASRRTRPRTLIAFARPSAMLLPECPPSPPLAVTESVTESGAVGSRGFSTWIHVSVLPAHPTVSFPSSSLSRLTRTVPVTNFGSRPFAPSRPTSSATVMRSSSGPWRFDSSSTSAIIAAIATPSSAPSVVPFAVSQSPSRASSILPSAGSFGLSGSRSQTMSRWPCSVIFGADSRPSLAGTRTTRFPAESPSTSKPCCSAQERTWSLTASSWREGRAILVSASKWPQNASGSSPDNTGVCTAIRSPPPIPRDHTARRFAGAIARDPDSPG